MPGQSLYSFDIPLLIKPSTIEQSSQSVHSDSLCHLSGSDSLLVFKSRLKTTFLFGLWLAHTTAPLKLRPYGAVEIYYYYRYYWCIIYDNNEKDDDDDGLNNILLQMTVRMEHHFLR